MIPQAVTLGTANQSSDTLSNSETAPDMPEAERWFKRSTGKGDLSQRMYTVYCWSMESDYPSVKYKFVQDIAALNTRAAAGGDTDEEMQALLVGEIYSKALHAVVMEKTGVELPAFIRHLGASLNKEVTRFNPTKLYYSTLRAAVHDAVQNYDAATKVPSSVDIAVVGPLVGRLQVLEKDLNNAIALMCNARQMNY